MVHGDFDIDPGDDENMSDLNAHELTQAAPHNVRLKELAEANICFMFMTRATSQFEMSPLKEVARKNICPMLVTCDTSQFEMSPLKELAEANIPPMLVTCDTSQFEMSPLKERA